MAASDPAAWSVLETLRGLLARDESIPALRVILFLWALGGAIAWLAGRARLALLLVTIGGALGLSYWLVQMRTPYGLGIDPVLTRQWAQAGVNAGTTGPARGYVVGAAPELSTPAVVARIGVPIAVVHRLPEIGVLIGLVLLATLPFLFFRNRSTACFAGALLVSGGLWPGRSPFDWLLQNPSSALPACAAAAGVAVILRSRRFVTVYLRNRVTVLTALIVVGALTQSSALLLLATAALVVPARVLIRKWCGRQRAARRVEAAFLLIAVASSGLLWWSPPHSVPGFEAAREPGTSLRRPLEWIQENVPQGEVVMASSEYSAAIAAIALRPVLFWPPGLGDDEALPEPSRRRRLYTLTLKGQPVARLAEHFNATHLFLGPGEAEPLPPPASGSETEPTRGMQRVYGDVEDFRVFRLTKK